MVTSDDIERKDINYARTKDQVNLYFEDTGRGDPIVFVHEFGGDHRSWENQVRFLSRKYRCITFAARGYLPSDVPPDYQSYSQQQAVDDIVAVMDHLGIGKAHVVGLSMGGFAAIHFGLNYPDRALSLVAAGAGYGAEKEYEKEFRELCIHMANEIEKRGTEEFGVAYTIGPSRVQLFNKNPRGWTEMRDHFVSHSTIGSANTMRGFQARRPSLYDLESELREMMVPTLIVTGDEDDHCLQPAIYMKRTIPASGLLVVPKSGHPLNLEEPELFNRAMWDFFAMVEAGRWERRDPRADPKVIAAST